MFLQIIQNVSLLLIAVFATYPLTEWLRGMGSELSRPIGIGFVLGSAAFLVSSVPIELHDGSVVDGRAGPMLFAGFLGGPVAGAVAAAIGSAARLMQGGPFALAGAFGFFIYAFAGVMLGLALRRAGKPARITTGNTVLLVLLSGVGLANTYWFIHPVELANAWFAGTMANVLLANAVSTAVMALAARFLTEAAVNRRRVRLLDERLDIAARHTGLGLWEFDPDARTMRGNAQYARIFGCDCADVPIDFDSWLRYLDPADRASEARALEAALHERRQFDREFRIITPQGKRRNIKSYGTILREPGGKPRRVVGLVFDITDMREAERIQREAEMRLADVARTLPGALLRYRVGADGGTELEYLNPACEEIFEVPAKAVRADPERLWSMLHPDDRPEQREILENALQGLAPTMTEFRLITPGGATKHLQTRAHPRRLQTGDVEFSVLVLDITEQVHLKQALSESRRLLHEAQRMDALGKLTGGVAHDFNNLLTVIMGNLELIGLDTRGEEREMFDDATEACRRGARLTKQLLTFSRKAHLQPRTVDLEELLARTRRLLARTLPKTITVEMHAQPGLHRVVVDPALLENALLNLALNARDAMPGGGTLRIEARNSAAPEEAGAPLLPTPGPQVEISVSDDGEGMSAEVLRRVYEPFFTTKQQGEGTGMGLAMVHGFVTQSNGLVDVASAPGGGTRVTLTFPANQDAVPADMPATDPPREEPATAALHVLLVEDEASVRRVIRRMLETMGYRVSEAADGAAGLRAIERGSDIDIVLSDIVMPGPVQGTQLARTVKRARPRLPVILMTGYARDATSDAESAEQDLMVVSKPVRRADLERVLHAATQTGRPILADYRGTAPQLGDKPAV